MTVPARKGTVLAKVEMTGGSILRSRFIRSRWSVPLVAYDGSSSGLSADGRTLVLIEPRRSFPRADTTFAVVAARGLRTRDVFTLRGDFSVDALSPDGRWLYLVEYLAPRDPTRYLVRLYDLGRHRLLPDPIIDPREVGDVMRGMPVTRAYSPDGRVAYTLYDGGEHPFIHALDTVERSARCIDLHGLMGFQEIGDLELDVSPDDGTIALTLGEGRSRSWTRRPTRPTRRRLHLLQRQRDWSTTAPAASRGCSSAKLRLRCLAALLAAQWLLKHRRRSEPQELDHELETFLREDDAVRDPERPRVPVG